MNDRQRTSEPPQQPSVTVHTQDVRPRRAYVAPMLKYLGSVRELTLGGTQGTRREARFTTRR